MGPALGAFTVIREHGAGDAPGTHTRALLTVQQEYRSQEPTLVDLQEVPALELGAGEGDALEVFIDQGVLPLLIGNHIHLIAQVRA